MPSPRPDRDGQHPEDAAPSSLRTANGQVLLSVSTTGEMHGSIAEIRQKLGQYMQGVDRLPDGQADLEAFIVPSCRLEITQPKTRFTVDRLTGDVRLRLRVVVDQGEITSFRVLAAHAQGSGVKSFSETAAPVSDAAQAVHAIAASQKSERGPVGKFFHRIGLAMGLESSLRADKIEPQLSGEVEGGKHIPTAAELARKFLGTATDQKTPAGFRTRYLQQLMDTVPQESQQCVHAANADGLQALVSALDDVARHPAFSTALESLSKGGGNEGSSSQSLMGGGSGQSERYRQLKAKYVGLQQTAESRLARMKGAVKTYGPPRQQNSHRASGSLGGWRGKGEKQ